MTGDIPTPGRCSPCPPQVTCSPTSQEEFLTALVRNLGCSVIHHDGEINIRQGEELSSMKVAMSDEDGLSCFPSLSLENQSSHESEEGGRRHDSAERHAATLLKRPLLMARENGGIEDDEHDDESHFIIRELKAVPMTMLINCYSSLTTLIKARLKAFVELLSLHALSVVNADTSCESVEGLESNLCEMLDRGASISLESAVSNFRVLPSLATKSNNSSSLPLRMTLSVGLYVPTDTLGNKKLVHASLSTSGTITGVFSEDVSEGSCAPVVELELDIEGFLSCLIQEASDIVAALVQETGPIATEGDTAIKYQPDQNLETCAATTPDLKQQRETRKRELSSSNKTVSIVSLSSCENDVSQRIFEDDGADQDEEPCSTLTPEKCESILDSVLDDPFCHLQLSPPKKQCLPLMRQSIETLERNQTTQLQQDSSSLKI